MKYRVNRFASWLTGETARLGLPEAMRTALHERANGLRDRLESPQHVEIALLGSTGSGKSTLINAILGVDLLHSSGADICTAAVTTVVHTQTPDYRANLTFLTRDEWEAELKRAENLLEIHAAHQEDPADGKIAVNEIKSLELKLRSIFALRSEEPLPRPFPQLPDHLARLIETGTKSLTAPDPPSLRKQLKSYVTADSQLWHFVKVAEISGPFDALSGGVKLVDLPGLNDPNPAREAVTRQYFRRSPNLWLVLNSKRRLTKDVRDFLVENDLIRQMMLNGNLAGFTMVATHADAFSMDEQDLDNLELPSNVSAGEAIASNNQRTLQACRATLAELAAETAMQAGEPVDKLQRDLDHVPVFTVASKSYQHLMGLAPRYSAPLRTKEETQLPRLIEHLRKIGQQQGVDRIMSSVEAELVLLFEEAALHFGRQLDELSASVQSASQQWQNWAANARQSIQSVRVELDAMQAGIESHFLADRRIFEERIAVAAKAGETRLQEAFSKWGTMHHLTLRATVSRDGSFTNSNGIRYNFNEDLARPLHEAIPFAWSDFFGDRLNGLLAQLSRDLEHRMRLFEAQLENTAHRAGVRDDAILRSLPGTLAASEKAVRLRTQETQEKLQRTILQTRADLAAEITRSICTSMQPGYDAAKTASGKGMKQQMVSALKTHATQQVKHIFDGVRDELTEGVRALGGQLLQDTESLLHYVADQAARVVENVTARNPATSSLETQQQLAQQALAELQALRDRWHHA